MANRSNKTNLDDFRRELEEDIKNFSEQQNHSAPEKYTSHYSESHITNSNRTYSSEKARNHNSAHHSTRNSSIQKTSTYNHRFSLKKKVKRRKTFKIICIILAIILLFAVGVYGFLQWELNRISRHSADEITEEEVNDTIDTEDLYGLGNSETTLVNNPNISNILLIGQDRKEGQKAEMRSDAMIICSINTKTKEITLCSLMRDMYVPIPGYGYGMLNHTYMIGGFELLNKTIEKNFGIPIDGDIEVDFNRFMNLIDILGGVDVTVTSEEAQYINIRHKGWNLIAGTNKLNSEQALYYCRIRENIGGDWGRTDRQRKVIMSAFNQLKSSGAKSMVSFAHEAMPSISTNMTNTKLIKNAYALVAYSMSADHSYRIPVEGTYTQEVKEETLHVLVPDIKKNATAIQHELYVNN